MLLSNLVFKFPIFFLIFLSFGQSLALDNDCPPCLTRISHQILGRLETSISPNIPKGSLGNVSEDSLREPLEISKKQTVQSSKRAAEKCGLKQKEEKLGYLYPVLLSENCPHRPVWLFDASLLFWQAKEEGLNIALKNDPLPIQANTNVNGSFIGIDFCFEPAIQLLLGVHFYPRSWDTKLRWTYFRTHTKRKEAVNSPLGFFPIWAFPSAKITREFLYDSTQGDWKLYLNSFDIEMGYDSYLSSKLSLRFNVGLKVVLLRQNFQVSYSNKIQEGNNQLLNAMATLKNEMIGAGPRIGLQTKWHIFKRLSFLASIESSLPLWQYRLTRKDSATNLNEANFEMISATSRQRFWTFRSLFETQMGLLWEKCFGKNNQYPFGISACYQLHYLNESNMFSILVNPGILSLTFFPRGDLVFHGVSLNFQFGF